MGPFVCLVAQRSGSYCRNLDGVSNILRIENLCGACIVEMGFECTLKPVPLHYLANSQSDELWICGPLCRNGYGDLGILEIPRFWSANLDDCPIGK